MCWSCVLCEMYVLEVVLHVLEDEKDVRCAPCAVLYAGGCGARALFAGGVGVDAMCAGLNTVGCVGWTLFAESVGGSGGTGGDALCAILYAGGCGA